MNVTEENLGACKRLLRIEVDPDTVKSEVDKVTGEFRNQAQIPGFRRGKAPDHLVRRSFGQRIQDQAKRNLMSEAYRQAVKEKGLRIVGEPEVEEVQFETEGPFQFIVRAETAPEFELPVYKGLPVQIEKREVTDNDIEEALKLILGQKAEYVDVSRPIQEGDYAVIHYKGTCEGQAITDIDPTAKGVSENRDFWVYVTENPEQDSFIPGFSRQLLGAQAGETRTVSLRFPDDFVCAPLAGKEAVYEVEVAQVKERRLPELNDELAASFGAESAEGLREMVRQDLENELRSKKNREIRNKLVKALMERVEFELPESMVEQETRNVVYDVVRDNQERGIDQETIEAKKDEIYGHATASARERVKSSFLLGRIAREEGIEVSEEEIKDYVIRLSQSHNIELEKLVKQLKERNALQQVHQELLMHKTIDFLRMHAYVDEVEASQEGREAGPPESQA